MNLSARAFEGAARDAPQWLWAPVVGAILVAVPAVIALATAQPWLVPSLGPTIFLQVQSPRRTSARPYPALMGHAVGAVAALIAVFIVGAASDPSPMAAGPLTGARAAATILALPLTIVAQLLLRAPHPPAAATTLLITLGGLKPDAMDLASFAGGLVAVVVVGEIARRLRVD